MNSSGLLEGLAMQIYISIALSLYIYISVSAMENTSRLIFNTGKKFFSRIFFPPIDTSF